MPCCVKQEKGVLECRSVVAWWLGSPVGGRGLVPLPVLGHVLKHVPDRQVPEYVLKQVPQHVFRHMPAKHVPKHVLK